MAEVSTCIYKMEEALRSFPLSISSHPRAELPGRKCLLSCQLSFHSGTFSFNGDQHFKLKGWHYERAKVHFVSFLDSDMMTLDNALFCRRFIDTPELFYL
jgi:hypothetical protein